MKWEKVKLSEVTEYITDGDHQPAPKSDSGVLFVKIKDIQDNCLTFDNALFVPQEYYNQLPKNRKAVYGDTLYTVVGSYGIPAFVNHNIPFCFERNIALLHPNNRVIPKYLYYAVKNPIFYGNANNIANGSAQKLIPLSKLAGMEVSVPPIERQETIVNILSAYDELIENNQKQIKLLEEAAQRLYKEWFVDLRFPGHETTPIVDGVPEGWRRERLVDLVDVQYGYAFDGSLFNTAKNGMPIIRIRNIPSGNTDDYTTEEADSRYIVHNGDILVGMDGEFHINSWSGPDAYLVQRTCSFRPNNSEMKGYLLQAIYEPIKYFENTVVGATVAHLGKKHIDTINVLTCPTNLYVPLQDYYEQRQLLLNQNWLLAEARDRLLPKLMSGEIEV